MLKQLNSFTGCFNGIICFKYTQHRTDRTRAVYTHRIQNDGKLFFFARSNKQYRHRTCYTSQTLHCLLIQTEYTHSICYKHHNALSPPLNTLLHTTHTLNTDTNTHTSTHTHTGARTHTTFLNLIVVIYDKSYHLMDLD